jgi:hypothetical protein
VLPPNKQIHASEPEQASTIYTVPNYFADTFQIISMVSNNKSVFYVSSSCCRIMFFVSA